MDVLEILMEDHRKVKQLLGDVVREANPKQAASILRTIKSELENHTHGEETVFYPAFAKYDEFKELLGESYKGHVEIKRLMREVPVNGPIEQLHQKAKELAECVEQHVQEEESDFFPRVRKVMKRNERETLGRHFEAAKVEKEKAA